MASVKHHFRTMEELKSFETIKGKVSKKYVPIYTSEVIQHLSPEFEFKRGVKYYDFNSAHSVYLDYNGATVSIENSYDRSRAFSFKYNDGSIVIPLDLTRQLHIGKKATTVSEEIRINKDEIMVAISNAKTIVEKLKDVTALPQFKADIEKVIFKPIIEKEGFQELLLHEVGESNDTVYKYINRLVKMYEEGDYHIKIKDKKTGDFRTRFGRKSSSAFVKLQTTNAVYKYLYDEYIEAFI